MLREVETVADNELVGNFKTAVVNLNVNFAATGLVKERANLYAVSLFVHEIIDKKIHGCAGVDNIFDEQNIATFGVIVEIFEDIDLTAGMGIGVVA